MKNNDLRKGFKLYDPTRDGKGISKNKPLNEAGLKRFFITLKENFTKIFGVNIIMVLGNFPVFFLVAVLSGVSKLPSLIPNDIYQNISGIQMIEGPTPFQMSIYGVNGVPNEVLVYTPLTFILIGIGALSIFTFGFVNVGSAFVLRNIAMGEPVFVWSDFWYAIKRNWKQALPFGILDALINALIAFNIYTTVVSSNFLTSLMFWSNILLALLYFFMRFYIYVQMVTFKLTVFKILKNSLIFALLGLKRNILALLGCATLILFELMFVFGAGGILISLGVAMPLAIMLSLMAYMKVYASYFKIKEVIIDPYKADHPEEFEENDDEDIIMHDDVTEAERLAEIKRKNGII